MKTRESRSAHGIRQLKATLGINVLVALFTSAFIELAGNESPVNVVRACALCAC